MATPPPPQPPKRDPFTDMLKGTMGVGCGCALFLVGIIGVLIVLALLGGDGSSPP